MTWIKKKNISLWIFFTVIIAAPTILAGVINPTTQEEIEKYIEARIITPSKDVYDHGTVIFFSGVGIYKLNNQSCTGCRYQWSSSIDGLLSEDLSFSTNNLSPGNHTIELKITTPPGPQTSAYKKIYIKTKPLNVLITSPNPEKTYIEGENIMLSCYVSGGIPPYTYIWYIDNAITGSEKQATTSLTAGNHTIKLEVKDNNKSKTEHAITIYVEARSSPALPKLKAVIETPKNNEIVKERSKIRFNASASGGVPPYTYMWTENNVPISSSKEFYVVDIKAGQNPVKEYRLTVKDSVGETATSLVKIKVESLCNRDGLCYTGENYLNCPQDCPSGSQDGYCDKIKDDKCDPDCEKREDADCLCDLNGLCDVGIENRANCPQDCPSGSQDGYCDKIKDGICDPDCEKQEDLDCFKDDSFKYFMVFVFAAVIVFLYLRFRRR